MTRATTRCRFLRDAAAATGAAAAALAIAPLRANASPLPAANVTLGDERFVRTAWRELHGRRVGIVTNQSGVLSDLTSVVDAVRRNREISLRAIFAPEHGFRGDRAAGATVGSYVDPETGLQVRSLYGATKKPNAAMLADVDVLLFDIQDVGDRAYTFISTLAYVMQAAKTYGKTVWVLDRPNPLGSTVEGPVLEPAFSSFIGLYPLPVRHGMTVGELAQLYAGRFGLDCDLRVIPMLGYTREMQWPDTGLPWVPTSPNVPTWETTFYYPATGLLDAAGVNAGIGTTLPFALAGAYGLDGFKLAETLNARELPGVYFRAAAWTPSSGFWVDKTLTGVQLYVSDRHAYRAIRAGVELLVAAHRQDPRAIAVTNAANMDRDWGTDLVRRGLADGLDASGILAQFAPATDAFEKMRERYLLY